jgi:hypothetical protein
MNSRRAQRSASRVLIRVDLDVGQAPGTVAQSMFNYVQRKTGRAEFKLQSFLSVGTKQQSRLKYSQSLMSIPFRLQS